jgi:hypothetical protein
MVLEIRSTKSEILNKFEIQSPNDQNNGQSNSDGLFETFEFYLFDIVSYFDIRI